MYKVIVAFSDLQDENYVYGVGDDFPRTGKSVDKARIDELSSVNNKLGTPLIELVGGSKSEKENKSYGKSEILRMSKSELIELAQSVGIDTDGVSGAELKEKLIGYYGL